MNPIESNELSNFLKLVQLNGFTRNLPMASAVWDKIGKYKIADAKGRFIKYLVVDSLGYGAVQALPADGSGAYPRSQRTKSQEAVAHYKEWGWTVKVPRVIMNKEGGLDYEYAKTMATELDNKQAAFARLKCAEIQGDGSGAIGVISSISVVGGNLVVTLSSSAANNARSFIRWFFDQDLVKIASNAGVAAMQVATGVNAAYFRVEDINEGANQVTLSAFSAADVQLTVVSGQTNQVATNLIYRRGSATPDLTQAGLAAGTIDYETLNHVMVGLPSLAANDGRLVHALKKSSNLAGTINDLGGALLDNHHFQALLSRGKRRASGKKGQQYKYSEAFMADESLDSLVASNETDRRFGEVDNVRRGFKSIGYKHGNDQIAFVADEFTPIGRIWVLPDGKDALAYLGGMPEQVAPNGSDKFQLSQAVDYAGAPAYGRENETHFEQTGLLITKHAAPILSLTGFRVVS